MKRQANIHFFRKLVVDELFDTLFFSTGSRVVKTKTKEFTQLDVPRIEVKIVSGKNIRVNGVFCMNTSQAKHEIMQRGIVIL